MSNSSEAELKQYLTAYRDHQHTIIDVQHQPDKNNSYYELTISIVI